MDEQCIGYAVYENVVNRFLSLSSSNVHRVMCMTDVYTRCWKQPTNPSFSGIVLERAGMYLK